MDDVERRPLVVEKFGNGGCVQDDEDGYIYKSLATQ